MYFFLAGKPHSRLTDLIGKPHLVDLEGRSGHHSGLPADWSGGDHPDLRLLHYARGEDLLQLDAARYRGAHARGRIQVRRETYRVSLMFWKHECLVILNKIAGKLCYIKESTID